jgi:hypothetical protein
MILEAVRGYHQAFDGIGVSWVWSRPGTGNMTILEREVYSQGARTDRKAVEERKIEWRAVTIR